MAECHPVGFQWVMEAKARGATVIHVDPRFTRTSAVADLHVPLRAGQRHRLPRRPHQPRAEHGGSSSATTCVAYTNAATILTEDFADTEDLDGLFSGLRPREPILRPDTWQYEGAGGAGGLGRAGPREYGEPHGVRSRVRGGPRRPAAARRTARAARPCPRARRSATRRCSTRAACSRCSSGTSPATRRRWSSRSAASRRTTFAQVCDWLTENSGRDRTTAFVYSVGWTQHTVGVQYIRTASILQLLLGNIGRPGGGILALRGHASIQGSTDIPTLFDLLPGYIPMPHAHANENLDAFVEAENAGQGLLGEHARLHGQPAQGLVGRRRDGRTTTSASTTCPGSPAATAPTRP